MSNRRRNSRRNDNPGCLGRLGAGLRVLVVGLAVLVLFILSAATGIDFLGAFNEFVLGTPRPPAVATTAPGVPTLAPGPGSGGSISVVPVGQGRGYQKGFWQVYFTEPASRDASTYLNGIDTNFSAALDAAVRSIDMAAFELNLPTVTQALIRAHQRGVRVRIVTDVNYGLGGNETTLGQVQRAGIPVTPDTRTALMHNKFTIIDGTTVWTGSWNYTVNDTYRNNNNTVVLRSQRAVAAYQAEFDEMLVGQFGPRSPQGAVSFTQDGVPIAIYFAPEDAVVPAIVQQINTAQRSVRFLAFSFTLGDIGSAMLAAQRRGVSVQGVFETTGSETQFSQLTPLFCARNDVRQDGNPYRLHHKVILLDDTTVITGSFNFSANATNSNDENLLMVLDPDMARLFADEFQRNYAIARVPQRLTC